MLSTIKKISIKSLAIAISLGLVFSAQSNVVNNTELTVEELRIDKAIKSMPDVALRLSARVDEFTQQVNQATNYTVLTQLVIRHGTGLWLDAKTSFNQLNDVDDRPLYWARIQMSKALRSSKTFAELFSNQQEKLLWSLELISRGQMDIKFDKNTDKKILLTGFDPFAYSHGRASGMWQFVPGTGKRFGMEGQTAEIEVLIVPVRFADFDQGMIEELLKPYIADKSVDMVLTVSMGRENFDLERYPALRRSANAPDNLNILTGATKSNPLVPKLHNTELRGPEFVEFSLPISSMLKGSGKYQVNDNRKVSTLSGGTFNGQALVDLIKQTSVSGSGGGYLSNEISYRSILLRDQFNLTLPVGHIHTPRIKAYDQQALTDIINQTKNIITQGVAEL